MEEKTITYSNGDIYEGEVENGVPNGHGKMTYSMKDKKNRNYYIGNWKNGHRDGQGTLYWTSGAFYDGEWANNERSGKGTYVFPGGKTMEGNWLNGEYIDNAQSREKNGTVNNNSIQPYANNGVAVVFTIFAVLCFIGGIIGGIIAIAQGFDALIPAFFAGGFVAGMLWLGIAEILNLLHDIRYNTDIIAENTQKQKEN